MSDTIRITRTAHPKEKPKDKDLAFGTDFTDHMFLMNFQEEKGWYDPRIEPYGPLALDPACANLHYGQGLFEGLKAFRGKDGTIRLFRPDKHVARLNRSAQRMNIPVLDPDMVLKSWTTLVGLDRDPGVVPPLRLDRDGELPHPAGEAATARPFFHRGEAGAEEGGGRLQDGVGAHGGAMEIPHQASS